MSVILPAKVVGDVDISKSRIVKKQASKTIIKDLENKELKLEIERNKIEMEMIDFSNLIGGLELQSKHISEDIEKLMNKIKRNKRLQIVCCLTGLCLCSGYFTSNGYLYKSVKCKFYESEIIRLRREKEFIDLQINNIKNRKSFVQPPKYEPPISPR